MGRPRGRGPARARRLHRARRARRTWRPASGARRRLTDAYLTMGAGTRAVSTDLGTIFDTDEPYGDAPAGEVYRRRTGRDAATHASCTSTSPQVDRINDVTDYGAKPGALGDALGDHDIARRVIGNADLGLETPAPLRYRRPAGATVMNGAGADPTRRRVPARVSCAPILDGAVRRRARPREGARGVRRRVDRRRAARRAGRGVGPEPSRGVRAVGHTGRSRRHAPRRTGTARRARRRACSQRVDSDHDCSDG